MSKSDLQNIAELSSNIIAKMGKSSYISMESLEKICIALECQLIDIAEIIHGEE